MTVPLVEMKDVHKSFYGVHVLQGVNFDVRPGEVHALMGENGAGKSTLMKILTGIHTNDNGTIYVKGEEITFSHPKEAEKAGIAVIHQELNIIPNLSVTENMFLGKPLTYGKWGINKQKEMRQKTVEYLQRLGIEINPDIQAGKLSVGQQQMIEIARAVSTNAEVIVMDEPTAALTEVEIETLFEVINHLKQSGTGIVYISHRMEEIFQLCDRISVLRDGGYAGTKEVGETSYEEIVKMMVGREIGQKYPPRTAEPGDVRLRVENLTDAEGLFENASFEVRRGEILGFAGLMGAGRTELMELLFGSRKKVSGEVYVDGERLRIRNPHDARKAGIGFITEDRKEEGLVLNLSVRENLALTNLNKLSDKGIMSNNREKEFVGSMIERLRVKTSGQEQKLKTLSGGNQQKIVIGKWLGIEPSVLILDEPTRGVDIGAKKEIYHIMNELTEQGVAIIMISSELPEVLGMSDRVLVLHEGSINGVFAREEADQESIMQAATGGGLTNE
ncbi:sugar ABC transporter ATP-binding protein [Salibacterium aidingense]|uniref:sugar ABC transporter ATP-binding protein n=1 Tax=Salibacterium aidingense TaxID=384933 RepID=UPI003BE400A7